MQTHTHTLYLVCLLVLFDQDGQVFPQGPDNVRRTLVGFTEQRHDGDKLAFGSGTHAKTQHTLSQRQSGCNY